MEALWLVLLLAVVLGGSVWVLNGAVEARATQASWKAGILQKYQDIDLFVSDSDRSFIGVDAIRKRVFLGSEIFEREYSFEDVLCVEIERDGVTLTKTNRGSQLAGAAVGAIAAGGIGALIGGLSGTTQGQTVVTRLSMKVVVNDGSRPNFAVTFFNARGGAGVSPDSIKSAINAAERFQSLLVLAIRESTSTRPVQEVSADDLGRLWDLKEKGALTNEEFNSAKERLLGTRATNVHAAQETFAVRLLKSDTRGAAAMVKLLPDRSLDDLVALVQRAPVLIFEGLNEREVQNVTKVLSAHQAEFEVVTR